MKTKNLGSLLLVTVMGCSGLLSADRPMSSDVNSNVGNAGIGGVIGPGGSGGVSGDGATAGVHGSGGLGGNTIAHSK